MLPYVEEQELVYRYIVILCLSNIHIYLLHGGRFVVAVVSKYLECKTEQKVKRRLSTSLHLMLLLACAQHELL